MSDAMRRTAASRRIVGLVKGIQALARDLRAAVPSDLNEESAQVIAADLDRARVGLAHWRDCFVWAAKEDNEGAVQ